MVTTGWPVGASMVSTRRRSNPSQVRGATALKTASLQAKRPARYWQASCRSRAWASSASVKVRATKAQGFSVDAEKPSQMPRNSSRSTRSIPTPRTISPLASLACAPRPTYAHYPITRSGKT